LPPPVLDVPALPACRDAGADPRVLLAERFLQVSRRPDVELPFLAFAIRVLGAVEAALGRAQIAQDVLEYVACHARVLRLARRAVCIEVGTRQDRLVLEHLVERWDEPAGVAGAET